MDRGDDVGPPAERGIALFERLSAWLEADALVHPEPSDPDRLSVETAAMVLLMCERFAAESSDYDDALKLAAMIGHSLVKGTAAAWNHHAYRAVAH